MDPKRRLDQNSGKNEQISGVKGGTPSEIPEERNNEMSKHQETPGLPGTKAGTTSARKHSHNTSQQPVSQGFPRSHPSIGHHCLQSSKTLQVPPTNEASTKDTKPLLSPRTGKELHSNFNQTSPHWEKKPLAEILSPTCSNKRQVNKDAERDGRGAKEGTAPPGGSEPEESSLYKLVPSFQFLVGQDRESGSSAGAEYKYRNQSPERNKPYPLQQPNKAKSEEGVVWICPRTGKELRCSATQTTFFWDGKTLSEYLHSTGRKASGPEIKQLLEAFPSSHQQPADQGSQQSRQQTIEQRYLQSKTTKQMQQTK